VIDGHLAMQCLTNVMLYTTVARDLSKRRGHGYTACFVKDCGLGMSDISQLSAEFTVISRDVLRTSWIDHIACSTYVNSL